MSGMQGETFVAEAKERLAQAGFRAAPRRLLRRERPEKNPWWRQ